MATVRWDAVAATRFKARLLDQYAQHGNDTAEDILNEVTDGIDLIRNFPEAAPATDRGSRIKTTTKRSYKIEYEYDPDIDTITIIRVSK